MAFLKRIRMVIMFMLLTSCNVGSNMEESHFSHNHPSLKKLIKPLSYVIKLELPFNEDDHMFSGEATYSFVIENPTRKIYLNSIGLTITQASNVVRYPYNSRYGIKNYHYSNGTETSVFDFETDIPLGFYNMTLKFRGNISEKEIGVYRTSCKDCDGASKWIFTTQLKPTAARRVFPCWDEPSLKVRFALEITHHRNYTVLSNMPIKLESIKSDSMMWTQFHQTPPIPIYLVAFSLTNFVCNDKEADVFTTRLCCRSLIKHQTEFALNTSFNVMLYLQWYMDISSQLSNITHIGLPDFPYEVIPNWGLNIYRESHLIHNETLHSIDHKLNVSTYVASMIAFQWFGNLVSPTSWTDMWFFQTLALFYGAKAAAKTYEYDITFMYIYHLQSLARENNIVSQVKPITYETNNPDGIDKLSKSYYFTNCLKGYAIMVMLENAITEKSFRNAAMKYLKKHQFSSATQNDFWNAIQDETIIYVLQEQLSIVEIVQSWLMQKSLPVITVRRKFDDIIIMQESMNAEKNCDDINNLWIPINYITKSHPKDVRYFPVLNGRQRINVRHIPLVDWIIVNWQHSGYYRVKYDSWIWRSLTTYLNSSNYARIHVLSRAHIIEDAHYFCSQNELSISRFVELISFMGREKQCAPWYAIQKVIQKMWTFINIDVGKQLRGVILHVLNTTLQEVGYTEHPDDADCVKFKRLLAMKWACRLFHEECLGIAEQRLIEHLEDPKSHIISPMWEEWTFCNGLVRSDMSVWNRVLEKFRQTRNMRILEYLGCSGDSKTIIQYLSVLRSHRHYDYIFEGSIEVHQNIYYSIVERHIKKNEVLDYAIQNLLKMNFGRPSFVKELNNFVKKVYSSTELDKIVSLLEGNINPNSTYYRERIKPKLEDQYIQIYKLKQLAY